MRANYDWHSAQNRTELAQRLVNVLLNCIDSAIEDKGLAVIALSGGSTPKPLFEALAKCDVDWSKVIITLVDERWVPLGHDLSNEAFLRKFLLSKLPTEVQFVSLYQSADSVAESIPLVLHNYCEITASSLDKPREFDAVVLGMGEDGHTASFFPDADNIAGLIDAANPNALLSCESASTQVPRVTWSLPMLMNSSLLALHITGESKEKVFTKAAKAGDPQRLPIRAAIFKQGLPLQVYYAD